MEIQYGFPLQGEDRERLRRFLQDQGLLYDQQVECSVCALDGNRIVGTGSLDGGVLKCIAVDPAYQQEGLAARIVTELISLAARKERHHLFIFTKPAHRDLFSGLGFYPVAQTEEVLLMENKKDGIGRFVSALRKCEGACIGGIVANCNPFTKGHLYLIETAARQCDGVYLFILSENKSEFPAEKRRDLALQGTAHIPNVIVQPTGPYLISSATFPEYFLKDCDPAQVNGALDLTLFAECFAVPLGITRRFVGTEPYSPATRAYNQQMKTLLPQYGIDVVELPRLTWGAGGAAVSASQVRRLLREEKWAEIKTLVPPVTYAYLADAASIR
jgi:[citrate (pro-3S)-lyase] ligase